VTALERECPQIIALNWFSFDASQSTVLGSCMKPLFREVALHIFRLPSETKADLHVGITTCSCQYRNQKTEC